VRWCTGKRPSHAGAPSAEETYATFGMEQLTSTSSGDDRRRQTYAPVRSAVRSFEMLDAVARGDRSAFERLYDAYSPTIYGVLLKICGNAEEAADVLQETFVQAWQNASRFDHSRGSEIAWLIMIARSRAIDRMRSAKTRSLRENEGAREIYGDGSFVDQAGADAVGLAQTRELVHAAMKELPEEQQRVLKLAYFEGKSHSEIAAELAQPLGSVKTRIQLGMKKLRARLAPLLTK
jgi:RNA polymerase sigma-70 factor (ECF subfamily)